MESMLTEISDPNVVLETITSQKSYLSLKPAEKETTAKDSIKKAMEVVKKAASTKTTTTKPERYLLTECSRVLRKEKVTLHAKDLGINSRTAMRWWKHYQETGKLAYEKWQRNLGLPNSLTPGHEQHIQQIIEKDSQLCADDIIDSLKQQFEDLKISKTQMNHYLRNNMLISIKKSTFDLMTRSSDNNLQTRYERFMKWKYSDLGYTKNCVFIDEAALRIGKQKKNLAGGKEQRAGNIIIE
ncbi:hypothetical protein G6F16_007295 [Rhizopus arrhizus]|nr:hypothetical protein G6F23_002527 [Rhizopus arrhizus]KAG0761991.1 hypothetical protein G6F24_007151 [Rhizopus arrhizus]KAG0796176.1 hypothetical protein G6F21_001528 [Rhizopus arrhizus]KAG0811793.1 hypothetical protein G6F20_006884 [Rhizopus arrhizus]KAG0832557.1 hypothetical protein G6F18_007166 [Rhizopus arrhizus]